MLSIALRIAAGGAGHLQRHVEALDHVQLALDVAQVPLARVDGDGRAHPLGERAADGVGLATRRRSGRRRGGRPRWPSARSGPAPVISTSSPRTGKASAVWTALPNGSKIAATSSSMPGQWCQTLVIGRQTYCGERAVAARRRGRRCSRTGGGARRGSGGSGRR